MVVESSGSCRKKKEVVVIVLVRSMEYRKSSSRRYVEIVEQGTVSNRSNDKHGNNDNSKNYSNYKDISMNKRTNIATFIIYDRAMFQERWQ